MTTTVAPSRPVERRHPLSPAIVVGIVAATITAAALGALISYSLGSVMCRNDAFTLCNNYFAGTPFATTCDARFTCLTSAPLYWAIAGGVAGLVGAVVVTVLIARSFGEWQMLRRQQRTDRQAQAC